MSQLAALDGLTASDVMHPRITSLDAATTVGELRAWFAVSGSRRLAIFVRDGRYAGAVPIGALDAAADDAAPALVHALELPVVAPGDPAELARDLALAGDVRRVPVVDEAGALLGVVALDETRSRFCGIG